MSVAMKMVGNWDKQMAVPIESAIAATIDITGKSGRDGCIKAMIYMAQSARAMTKQAKKNRKILRDNNGKYITRYNKQGQEKKMYEWAFKGDRIKSTWEQAKQIRNRGLAKRSWMWGLKTLAKNVSKPIPGVASLEEFIGKNACGLILTNRLGYIADIMPAGYQEAVAQKASNKIMAQVAKKIEKRFGLEVPRLAASRAKRAGNLGQSWRKAA